MIERLLRRADRSKGVSQALRLYLWWGILLRGVLLAGLGTLLLVEGNFLAEWLFSWQIAPSTVSDIEEFTAISYVAFVLFLGVGLYLRWLILRQLNAVTSDDGSAASSEDGAEPASPA